MCISQTINGIDEVQDVGKKLVQKGSHTKVSKLRACCKDWQTHGLENLPAHLLC